MSVLAASYHHLLPLLLFGPKERSRCQVQKSFAAALHDLPFLLFSVTCVTRSPHSLHEIFLLLCGQAINP